MAEGLQGNPALREVALGEVGACGGNTSADAASTSQQRRLLGGVVDLKVSGLVSGNLLWKEETGSVEFSPVKKWAIGKGHTAAGDGGRCNANVQIAEGVEDWYREGIRGCSKERTPFQVV